MSHSAGCSEPGSYLLARALATLLGVILLAGSASARVLLTLDEALQAEFGDGVTVERTTVYVSEEQLDRARTLAGPGVEIESAMLVRYDILGGGEVRGHAYVDRFVIRTLPATVLYVVTPSDPPSVALVEILSWAEPPDYLPRAGWTDELHRKLDEELSTRRAVPPITGATLSAEALTKGARRVLALHLVTIEEGAE